MKSDTSRRSFRVDRHATSVRKQQGRVDLDADWNEQQDIDAHLRTTALSDVVGADGAPLGADGLGLVAAGADLRLTAGRLYVGGVLCECDAEVSVFDQPDLPAGVPELLRADGVWTDVPPAPAAGVYVAAVDVWQQHRGAVEDPTLREIALNGPDTTTRVRTVWQVRLLHAGTPGADVSCVDDPPGWAALTAPSTGTLAAWAKPDAAPPADCVIPASASYRGLDNQHYRVEISGDGAPGAATYVWSRDNGSVVVSWVGRDGDVLTVKNPGRDGSSGFTNGCWVQLTDDHAELRGDVGTLAQVDRVQGDELVLKSGTIIGPLTLSSYPAHPRVRRWDGEGVVPADGSDVSLELGVTVRFAGSAAAAYRVGDYWSFPARSAVHDVIDWPQAGGGGPADVAPHGPSHAFARLGVVEFDGTNWSVNEDCRALFPPLSGLIAARYAGGDGQHAAPDPANAATLVGLGQQLRASVTNGSAPVAGAFVRFAVTAGSGRVDAGGGPATSVDAATGPDGVAAVSWAVDSSTAVQHVTAHLLRSGGATADPPIVYTATLLRASGVTVDPSACPGIAGTTNVQQALEKLCATATSGCASIVISPGGDWAAPIRALAAGSSARICFRPGEYHLAEPLMVAGLAALVIDGSGDGSLIVADQSEVALRFVNCAQVVVRDLAVQANVVAAPGPGDPGQGGVITAVDCASVEVSAATLRCSGGSRRAAACLNVQRPDELTVRDCRLEIGHLQSGVIVVDGRHVRIGDNVLAVRAKSDALRLDRLLEDPRRRRRLVGRLVSRPMLGAVEDGGTRPPIVVGDFVATFDSTISRGEWTRLIADNPPTAADTASATGVRNYLAGIADAAVADPARFPAVETRFTSLRGLVGANAFDDLRASDAGRLTLRNSILGGAIDVIGVGAVPGQQRTNSVTRSGSRVRFDSPVPAAAWSAALDSGNVAVASDEQLKVALYRAAERAITDAAFRDQFPAFRNWYQGLVDRNLPAASLGVLCAGRRAEDVVVEGNTMYGVYEGVRVAVSHAVGLGEPVDVARSVRVCDNVIHLEIPVEQEFGRQGIMLGNVENAVVAGNHLRRHGGAPYLIGVRTHGYLGSRLLIEGNVAENTSIGVHVRIEAQSLFASLWMVRDNVTPEGIYDIPEVVQQVNNIGV